MLFSAPAAPGPSVSRETLGGPFHVKRSRLLEGIEARLAAQDADLSAAHTAGDPPRVARGARPPTSVHDPAVGLDVHVADSLSALEIPALRTAGLIADLGAGGGLPGLVLAATLPDARVVMVESHNRKCAFIRDAAAAMGLRNVEVACVRARSGKTARARATS